MQRSHEDLQYLERVCGCLSSKILIFSRIEGVKKSAPYSRETESPLCFYSILFCNEGGESLEPLLSGVVMPLFID